MYRPEDYSIIIFHVRSFSECDGYLEAGSLLKSVLSWRFCLSGINAIGTLAARCCRWRYAQQSRWRRCPRRRRRLTNLPRRTRSSQQRNNAAQEAAAQLAIKTNPSWRSQTQDAVPNRSVLHRQSISKTQSARNREISNK